MQWYNTYKIAGRKEQVALKGILCQTTDGFVYVNVPNDIINGFYYSLGLDEVEQPPYRESKFNGIGAHISVMNEKETEGHEIPELGKTIKYWMKGVFEAEPEKGRFKKIWAVEVHSPELEEIRKRYGLSPKLWGHEFHITFGIQRKKDT